MKLYRIYALMQKYWYISTRRLDRILEVFYWPLIGMLVWGFTTYYVSDLIHNNSIINIFLGGAILWTFFIMAQTDIGIFILEDMWSGNTFNLFASPVKNFELIISTALFGLLRSIISFIFIIWLAFIFYSFNLLKIGIVYLVVFASGLALFGWVVGIFMTSLVFRYGARVQSFVWTVGWLIQPFSAVYYPIKSLPPLIQKISLLLPTTYIFEGMRTAFLKESMNWSYLFLSFGINIALLILVCIFFNKSIQAAKKKGMLRRYME